MNCPDQNRPFCLETERLLLRDFIEADWAAIYAMSRESAVTDFQSWLRLADKEAARRWVMEVIHHNSDPQRQSYNLAIVLQETGQVIGWLGWGPPSDPADGDYDFGYALLPSAWGQGLMTEALTAAVRFMFDSLSAGVVYGECNKVNRASARVMQKAGFYLAAEWMETDPVSGQRDTIQRYEAMKPMSNTILSTKRLRIRQLTDGDVDALYAIFSHPEVMRYWSSPPWTSLAQAEGRLVRALEGYQSGEDFQWGIERKEDSALLGACSLFSFNRPSRRCELGYALGRPYWGEGYMGEALRALVAYAFETLDLNRLEADIDPRNTASAKTLERLGFQKEGFMPERWIVAGEVSDTQWYGLLRSNWKVSGR